MTERAAVGQGRIGRLSDITHTQLGARKANGSGIEFVLEFVFGSAGF